MNTADIWVIDSTKRLPAAFPEVLQNEVAKTSLRGQYVFTNGSDGHISVSKLADRTTFDLKSGAVHPREARKDAQAPLSGPDIPAPLRKELETLRKCVERAYRHTPGL